jgi:hypothetical protein
MRHAQHVSASLLPNLLTHANGACSSWLLLCAWATQVGHHGHRIAAACMRTMLALDERTPCCLTEWILLHQVSTAVVASPDSPVSLLLCTTQVFRPS